MYMRMIVGLIFFILVGMALYYFGAKKNMNERIVKHDAISLWTQSFGDSKNPAILLIAGAGAAATFWTKEFIQHFVDNNYFVIVYILLHSFSFTSSFIS